MIGAVGASVTIVPVFIMIAVIPVIMLFFDIDDPHPFLVILPLVSLIASIICFRVIGTAILHRLGLELQTGLGQATKFAVVGFVIFKLIQVVHC